MTNEVPYPPPTNGVFRSFPLLLSESNIRKESCKTFLIEMHLQQQIIKIFASKLGQSYSRLCHPSKFLWRSNSDQLSLLQIRSYSFCTNDLQFSWIENWQKKCDRLATTLDFRSNFLFVSTMIDVCEGKIISFRRLSNSRH